MAGAGGESRRWWAAARPAALALGTHGAGRRRGAVPPHLPPARPPAVTPLGACTCQNQAGASSPRRAILPPGKLAAKGAAYGRVAASLRFTSADPGLRASPAKTGTCREDGEKRRARCGDRMRSAAALVAGTVSQAGCAVDARQRAEYFPGCSAGGMMT